MCRTSPIKRGIWTEFAFIVFRHSAHVDGVMMLMKPKGLVTIHSGGQMTFTGEQSLLTACLLKTRSPQELNTICITTTVNQKEQHLLWSDSMPGVVAAFVSVFDVLVTRLFLSESTDQELNGVALSGLFWHTGGDKSYSIKKGDQKKI